MTRVNFIVEGPTEETFVNDVLCGYMSTRGIYPKARSIETSRRGMTIYRGGMTNYEKAKRDIQRWLSQDSDAFVTTMFDFYALPNDFPGMSELNDTMTAYQKVEHVQKRMEEDINNDRFIAYIQLHEFEALLFSDIEKIDTCMELYAENGHLLELESIIEEYDTPEHINNSPKTAPSKRLKALYRSYDKVFLGSLISEQIGLEEIKNKCSHFEKWINRLTDLSFQEL